MKIFDSFVFLLLFMLMAQTAVKLEWNLYFQYFISAIYSSNKSPRTQTFFVRFAVFIRWWMFLIPFKCTYCLQVENIENWNISINLLKKGWRNFFSATASGRRYSFWFVALDASTSNLCFSQYSTFFSIFLWVSNLKSLMSFSKAIKK